jgi:DNA-binding NtrC family response regulator
MTPPTQTKILRVLQSGTFERVGGNQPIKVNVRVIAATNKPLEQAVAAREFREDLFYRLNVVRIQIPPLRDRREDIPLLVNYFLSKIAKDQQRKPKSIAAAAVKALEKYHWPGNVRELENIIRRARTGHPGAHRNPGQPSSSRQAARYHTRNTPQTGGKIRYPPRAGHPVNEKAAR